MDVTVINANEEIDEDSLEQVGMRVNVHSGSINCGIFVD